MVDESILTGESVPVDKGSENQVFSGTLLVRGKTLLEATQTGPASAMGRLATMLDEIEISQTPLQRRVDALGRQIAGWVVAVAALLGLVLFWDPPRAEVPHAVQAALRAGIRVVMITGDHPATALAIARQIGIRGVRVLTGEDLAEYQGDALREALTDVNVFARVRPEQKLQLVESLKAQGQIVAMTGDGVNDAPALKRADVGVAISDLPVEAHGDRRASNLARRSRGTSELTRSVRRGVRGIMRRDGGTRPTSPAAAVPPPPVNRRARAARSTAPRMV